MLGRLLILSKDAAEKILKYLDRLTMPTASTSIKKRTMARTTVKDSFNMAIESIQ